MIVLIAGFALAGCLLLALGQDRHWKSVMGTSPADRTRTLVRIAGGALVGAAFALSLALEGAGFAVLVWTLLVGLASFVVAMMLAFRQRRSG